MSDDDDDGDIDVRVPSTHNQEQMLGDNREAGWDGAFSSLPTLGKNGHSLGDNARSGFAHGVSITRPFRAETTRALTAFCFDRLRRKQVIVRTNGFNVRGMLHGVDETDLYLRGEFRWFVLPLATITSVITDPDAVDDDDDDDVRRND